MIAKYKLLLDNSVSAALSAIEIYNKPDFKYRNEIFVILIINSWELLLKAKIIKENKNKITSIYKYKSNGRIIRNRNKTPMTIDLLEAINKTQLNDTLRNNLTALTDIRDSAIHFYNKESLSYLIYSLGVATLKNYQKLIKEWFDKDLLKYNFYILPLGFAYNFQTFSPIAMKKEPTVVQNIIHQISYNQQRLNQSDYKFICEIEVNLKSAKKVTENTDLKVAVTKDTENIEAGLFGSTIIQKSNLIDRYPLSYSKLFQMLKAEIPELKKREMNAIIKRNKIKDNPKYSAYNFRTKEKEEKYKTQGVLSKATPSIYNYECFIYLQTLLKAELVEN